MLYYVKDKEEKHEYQPPGEMIMIPTFDVFSSEWFGADVTELSFIVLFQLLDS